MSKEEQEKIIESIIEEVDDRGSARLGFHADKILNGGKPGRAIPYNTKSKIEGKITASGKYRSRPHPNFTNDFEVLVNPDYKEKSWTEKNPFLDKLRTGAITAIFTLIVGFILYYFTTGKYQSQKEAEQDAKLSKLDSAFERRDIMALYRSTLNLQYLSLDTSSSEKILESVSRLKTYLENELTNNYLVKNKEMLKQWNVFLIVVNIASEDLRKGRKPTIVIAGIKYQRQKFADFFTKEFQEKIVIPLLNS